MENTQLTEQEKYFCNLYVHGDAPYCGNASECYKEALGKTKKTKLEAMMLLGKPHIQGYIEELNGYNFEENMFLKKRLTANLLKIMDETSKAEYVDRRGTKLSPAPLRSVAVQAAKALMELHPIKEANKLSIESEGDGGIVFNVIVPDKKPVDTEV